MWLAALLAVWLLVCWLIGLPSAGVLGGWPSAGCRLAGVVCCVHPCGAGTLVLLPMISVCVLLAQTVLGAGEWEELWLKALPCPCV